MTDVAGVLLAAGAGTRMGRPKALVEGPDGTPWVVSAVRTLRDGGCGAVVVVIGAEAETVRACLAGEDVTIVEPPDWADGMGVSLGAGLRALEAHDAALVHLVDLPDVGPDVVRRLARHAAVDVLARADYGHGPGHPVLLGRDHWAGVIASVVGDQGARAYLDQHDVLAVDCRDLATGVDVDRPGPMLGR
ncbi:nucleotidyltransferase family protein [Aeromicrobium ginsengisoli]|uniref:Nucleotidyltransferase family protein n=1 Tax=Aeromicrobium ginsengisoli TaxID=363867 RepID=A0A5M4F9L1_9ACTN|nr:nucleotidyltransferase family protein [Aeromicrobium ginsengisoli]KAA1394378.1 nucleotidyltransferase family protein [Aeromicrobium ginsengisoli]